MKELDEMTNEELYIEAFCGLVCPFPRLNVIGLLSKEELEEQLGKKAAYDKRKADAKAVLYKRLRGEKC